MAWKIRATSTTRATVSTSASSFVWFGPSPTERQAIDDKTVASAETADSDSDWHDVKPDLCSMGAEVRLDVDSDKRDMETDDNGADSSDNLLPQVNARFTAVRCTSVTICQYFLNKKWVR